MKSILQTFCALLISLFAISAWAADPLSLEAQYASEAKKPASASRGEIFFTSKHSKEWSCASCHGAPPTKEGKHLSTNKSISPLAPAINATRFTNAAKVDKWFKRNCNDVLGRECAPIEKADVMAYLNSFK